MVKRQQLNWKNEEIKVLIALFDLNIHKKIRPATLFQINNYLPNHGVDDIYGLIESVNSKLYNKNDFEYSDYQNQINNLTYSITIHGQKYIDGIIDYEYEQLISEMVFDKTELSPVSEDIWQPLPIEDPVKLQEGIKSTETAIKEIEADNGYAATHPEERNAVLGALKAGWESLKNNQVVKWTKGIVVEALKKALTKFGEGRITEWLEKALKFWENLP